MKGATPAQPLSLLLPFHSIFILQYSSSHLNQRSKNKWSELSEMKFMEFVWLASFVEWMGYGPWPSSAANINFTLSWRVALSCFALQLTCPSEDRPASISYSFNSIQLTSLFLGCWAPPHNQQCATQSIYWLEWSSGGRRPRRQPKREGKKVKLIDFINLASLLGHSLTNQSN